MLRICFCVLQGVWGTDIDDNLLPPIFEGDEKKGRQERGVGTILFWLPVEVISEKMWSTAVVY